MCCGPCSLTSFWSRDRSETLQSGPGMLLDRFSTRTVDSGPDSERFRRFWPEPTFWAGLGQARDWPEGLGTSPETGRKALAQPILFFSHEIKKHIFLFCEKNKVWAGPGPPGQSLGWSQGLPASGLAKSRPKCRFGPKSSKTARIGSRIDGSG